MECTRGSGWFGRTVNALKNHRELLRKVAAETKVVENKKKDRWKASWTGQKRTAANVTRVHVTRRENFCEGKRACPAKGKRALREGNERSAPPVHPAQARVARYGWGRVGGGS